MTNHGYSKNEIEDGYPRFEELLNHSFLVTSKKEKALFYTKVENLFDLYLNNIPESIRQHYNCNCCRNFINQYGGLAYVDGLGNLRSALWSLADDAPVAFEKAVKAMKQAVESSSIKRPLVTSESRLGRNEQGGWSHLSVSAMNVKKNGSVLKTDNQVMAQKVQDYLMLRRAVDEYETKTVEQAYSLLSTDTLYRGDKVAHIADWFLDVKNEMERFSGKQQSNMLWAFVANAPEGFTHVRSSMIGTLLDDIQSGLSTRVVMARFNEKMSPENYMRSTSTPSAQTIQNAEKVIETLGLEESLGRRYVELDELEHFVWTPSESRKKPVDKKTRQGVFGNLVTENNVQVVDLTLPVKTMTWERFVKTLLPQVNSMEVMVENSSRFMAMVRSTNPKAKNILKWDNDFSWYYHSGIDGEIKRRVEEAGGRYEDNKIRVSLSWESYTDLDLHAILPNGKHLYYGDKHDYKSDGYLDIDMNAGGGQSMKPVENMRWARNPQNGLYKFYVHNFVDRNYSNNPYVAELEVGGQVYRIEGVATYKGFKETLFEFYYENGTIRFVNEPKVSSLSANWGLESKGFVKVNAITESPNTWGENPKTDVGHHVFFLLDGMKDEAEGKGRGFFNEMLLPDLREIRKTLELYTAQTPIDNIDNASACGVGYSKDLEDWNLTLKVNVSGEERLVKIDRIY